MKKSFIIKSCLLFLFYFSCAPVKVIHGPAPYTDVTTQITFPSQLGVLKKVAVQIYRDQLLGLGVRYIGPDYFKTDIYIYQGGYTGITDGVGSKAVTSMYRQALDDIMTAGTMGYYQEIKVVEEKEITFGSQGFSLPALFAACRCQAHDREVVSYLVLTGFRGHFLKIRCSFPQDNTKGPEVFDQLIADFSRVLAE